MFNFSAKRFFERRCTHQTNEAGVCPMFTLYMFLFGAWVFRLAPQRKTWKSRVGSGSSVVRQQCFLHSAVPKALYGGLFTSLALFSHQIEDSWYGFPASLSPGLSTISLLKHPRKADQDAKTQTPQTINLLFTNKCHVDTSTSVTLTRMNNRETYMVLVHWLCSVANQESLPHQSGRKEEGTCESKTRFECLDCEECVRSIQDDSKLFCRVKGNSGIRRVTQVPLLRN